MMNIKKKCHQKYFSVNSDTYHVEKKLENTEKFKMAFKVPYIEVLTYFRAIPVFLPVDVNMSLIFHTILISPFSRAWPHHLTKMIQLLGLIHFFLLKPVWVLLVANTQLCVIVFCTLKSLLHVSLLISKFSCFSPLSYIC